MRPLAVVHRAIARRRTFQAALFAVWLLSAADAGGRPLGTRDDHVVATPIALSRDDPGRRRVGRLSWLGGWVLSGRDSRFGGWSSLSVEGDRFLSISDTGSTLAFRFDGRRIAASRVADLPAFPGGGLTKMDRDAESLARDPATGALWIGYENSNEIWRYDRTLTRTTGHVARAEMARWPLNGGAESLVRLRDGRFLVIGETAKGPVHGTRPLLIFPGDPVSDARPALAAGYRPPAGFDPSDAAELPDGRLVILNRRVSLADGFVCAVTVIDPADARPGAVLDGTEIARIEPPLAVDNMEGIVARVEGGRTVLWMISDDNFMPFERTLLMKWTLDAR